MRMTRRLAAVSVPVIALSLLGLTTAGTVAITSSAVADPACAAGPLACGADVAAMKDLEAKAVDHFHNGFMIEVSFKDSTKKPGEVVAPGGYGDSGLWTGVYLGGESFRYATAKKKLASGTLTAAETADWQAQKTEAYNRIKAMVVAFDRNVNIASAWKTTTKIPPKVDPGNSVHPIDFGGGIIKGEPGMLMRACTPVGDPLGIQKQGPDDRVFGPFKWKDGINYLCETAPSRDTYAGTTFGLLTAFDLVSGDDPAMRRTISTDLLAMGNFLLKYGWNYPRPHGYISAQHDFDGAISPLFVYVPSARLNMANAVRHVVAATGNKIAMVKWDAAWKEELATQGPILAASMVVDSAQPNQSYYKFNLNHLTLFNLIRTTTGAERTLALQALSTMDATTGDDINAHFEAITYWATGEVARRNAAVTHLREWLNYRANADNGVPAANSAKCGATVVCVPDDKMEMSIGGQPPVTLSPGTVGKRAARPLPVVDRPPTDFLWQRPPTQLDGSVPTTFRAPGIDYLTPYWMLRYETEVAELPVQPFPPSLRPSFY